MNGEVALAVPLFRYAYWSKVKLIFARWLRDYRTFFVPFAFYKLKDVINVKRSLLVDIDLRRLSTALNLLVSQRVREILRFCREANVASHVRLILHTEYQCMVWDLTQLVELYATYAVRLVELLESSGIKLELIEIELHPGFAVYMCTEEGYVLSNSTKFLDHVAYGMQRLVSNIVGRVKCKVRVTVECRGSSIFGDNVSQVVSNLRTLELLLRKLSSMLTEFNVDVGFTADPWQEARLCPVDDIFDYMKRMVSSGFVLHDVHVHWNVHAIPPPNILVKFMELIDLARSVVRYVIFVTPEVTKVSKSEQLAKFLQVLEQVVRIT